MRLSGDDKASMSEPFLFLSPSRGREKIVYGCRLWGIISSILFYLIMTPRTTLGRSFAAVPYCRLSCQTFRYFRLLPSKSLFFCSFCPTLLVLMITGNYGQRNGQRH